MLGFLTRRIGAALVLFLVVITASFFLLAVLGPDPARSLVAFDATEAQVAAKRAELGLDVPALQRFWEWFSAAITGDLGTSWATNQPVAADLATRLPVTISLAVATTIVAALVGASLGYFAAMRGGALDRALQIGIVIGHGLPGFWVALMLASVFAVQLGWFPATGYIRPEVSLEGWLRSITLPVAALAIGATASIAQQMRDSTLDVLSQDYVRTLRSRGLPPTQLALRHIVRNAAPASVGVLSLQFIGLLGGTILVENIFALPGLGSYIIGASSTGDIPAVLGTVMVTMLAIIVVTLIVDLVVGTLNPKARVR